MKIQGTVLIAVLVALPLIGCGAPAPTTEPAPGLGTSVPELAPTPAPPAESGVPLGNVYLTPNPVEEAMPQYGGIVRFGQQLPTNFDGHQKVAYGPVVALPTFNQLVIYNLDYKETVPENLVGDLAEKWEISPDGTEITFNLRQGVKWHDGLPFTADDVVYSLDKMTDVNRSAISAWFPAYESAERLSDYAVKVHLKYPSGGFLTALAEGEAVIQPKHLAGTNDQSADFMVGTGPFIVSEYLVRVHIKYKKNPNYFKKDRYGNQLPYVDELVIYEAQNQTVNEMLISRRIDFRGATAGAATVSTYEYLSQGAPELLWRKLDLEFSAVMFLNTKHKPLDDVRVRRAMGLIVDEESLIIGYSGDARFGITDIGILNPSLGLPREEVRKLMGWDKPYEERVNQAQRLMAEAGYPEGFKLNILSDGSTTMNEGAATLVFADALRRYLKIDSDVNIGLGQTEIYKRRAEGNFDLYTTTLRVERDPTQFAEYASTGGHANYSGYSNPEVDRLLSELDRIFDPTKRRQAVWAVERILLTDLPMLPTGTFIGNLMPYYPHVKNLRWVNMRYSNTVRLEDVWIDESLRVK